MSSKAKLFAKATTYLFALLVLPGAVMNIVQPEMVGEMAVTLGIPTSMLTLVGIWKLLGIAALLSPGFPRLKEWAYAGFFFDLTGAAYLHFTAGDVAGSAPALVFVFLLAASYFTRSRSESGEAALNNRLTSSPSPQAA